MGFWNLGQVQGLADPGAAAVGAGLAGDVVHHGGLAGAVGADDAAQFADADVEIELAQGLEAVEADLDAFQAEDGAVTGVQARAGAMAEAAGFGADAGIEHFRGDGGYGGGFHASRSFLMRPITPRGR